MSSNPNIHRFIVTLTNSHLFNLIVDGFAVVNTLLITIRLSKIRINILTVSLITKLTLSLRVKKILFTLTSSLIKLTTKLTLTLRIKKILITAIMRMTIRLLGTNIYIKKIAINALTRLVTRITSFPLAIKKITIVATAVIASYIKLYVHDPKNLYTMDSQMLQDLDYTAS